MFNKNKNKNKKLCRDDLNSKESNHIHLTPRDSEPVYLARKSKKKVTFDSYLPVERGLTRSYPKESYEVSVDGYLSDNEVIENDYLKEKEQESPFLNESINTEEVNNCLNDFNPVEGEVNYGWLLK